MSQPTVPESTYKQLIGRIKFDDVVTGVVQGVVLAMVLGGFALLWAYVTGLREQDQRRTLIAAEIRHRLPFAREEIAANNADMAKRRLEGVDPRFCLHEELSQRRLITLVAELRSLGVDTIDDEILKAAAQPQPPADQLTQLVSKLDAAVPSIDWTTAGSSNAETVLQILRAIFDWPLVVLVLGLFAISRLTRRVPAVP